ncbi:probable AAD14-Putative aryl-alcohol reductase [Sporisorium reilianum f. sp. reilianum]|uniref:Probable AAD14-Putative aryl-alcohol reductase n=1 Tax=Sporisorium reilianum f. sp. reilianum TaxID=72559 RepID=A0A2N8UA16_9BASI|nr:probable AAD14-Putative aryl-alcohol reductase [Sporisorium reilianum f. sp. reilianum]
MGLFDAEKPVSKLDRHRVLAPKAGVRVSPLCFGAMSIGDKWKDIMSGGLDKQGTFELLDRFHQLGGNFIDTANVYTDGQSEEFLGEWMETRGIRDEIVLATKATSPYKAREQGTHIGTNFVGNSTKSIFVSTRDSLKKLRTDYIDIMYIHWWDWSTSIEEMMHALNQLVVFGKVLYLGASDTPAWVVSAANTYARAHGLAQFVVYQGKWNAMEHDFERDIIPMAREFGMALAPWGALGQGRFKTPEQVAEREKTQGPLRGGGGALTEKEKNISAALHKLGQEELGGLSITGVALAYVYSKYPYVFPIVGGTKISHLEDNIKAIGTVLTDEQINKIEEVAPFDIGFPLNMIRPDPHLTGETQMGLHAHGGHLDWVKHPKAPSFQ